MKTKFASTLLGLVFLATSFSAAASTSEDIDLTTLSLLNGVLNKRGTDAEMEKCLKEFRSLEADIVDGQVTTPTTEEEAGMTYTLNAEKYVKGGVDKYVLTIEAFEGGYSCSWHKK